MSIVANKVSKVPSGRRVITLRDAADMNNWVRQAAERHGRRRVVAAAVARPQLGVALERLGAVVVRATRPLAPTSLHVAPESSRTVLEPDSMKNNIPITKL